MNSAAKQIILSFQKRCFSRTLISYNIQWPSVCHRHFLQKSSFLGLSCQNVVSFQLCCQPQITAVRYKSNKRNRASHRDSDDEDSDSEDIDAGFQDFKEGSQSDKNLAILKVQSLRLDTLLKVGLGISKNKIEKHFYKGRLRLNGKKFNKKSQEIRLNDEIDLVHNIDEENDELLDVGRIEVLDKKLNMTNGLYHITVRRFKKLKIENYSGSDRFSRTSED